MTMTEARTVIDARSTTDATTGVASQPHVTVLVDRCVGCQECIVRCPTAALSLDVDAYVAAADDGLCVGCRQCERTCPFHAIEVSGAMVVGPRVKLPVWVPGDDPEALLGDRLETRRGIASWDEALNEADRCLACPDPTCVRGCPAHNDIPAFIAALGRRDLTGAQEVLGRTSVLPDICSRVCDQAIQCEGACSWSLAGGEAVAIGALERFVTDHSLLPAPTPYPGAGSGMRVAVVGSGPAGIAAAWELIEAGAQVTIYDRDAVAGGLLRWGIPDFTLSAEIASRPINALAAAGVEFRLGVEVQPDDIDRLIADNDAVILAVGAGRPLRLRVPGADLDGVWDAGRFLVAGSTALAIGSPLPELAAPGRVDPAMVLVLGAGNTAMDVARTARRLGARAVCVDWMDRRFAPVRPDELAEAEGEGVEIRFLHTLERLDGDGSKVTTAWLARTNQRKAGTRPKVRRGPAERLDVDLVVMAMGYTLDPAMTAQGGAVPVAKTVVGLPDRTWMASGILANTSPVFARHQPVGTLALGREIARRAAGVARRPGLWVAGDALTGPATVVDAMAQGKEAARGVLALGERASR